MPKSSSSSAPDAIAVLKDDHQTVEKLFQRFEKSGPRALKSRREIVDKLIEQLSVHAAVEESTFYPVMRERLPESVPDVLEALEEHHLVKTTLAELERLGADDERFAAKVTVLAENVRHHVKEEEKELFPQVRSAFTKSELSDMGETLRLAKRTAPTRPHPHAPDTQPGNIVAAALTAPIDAARSAGGAALRAVRSATNTDN